MTGPARLIAIHTLIGAITEGGEAIVEHYHDEGPSPDMDRMIAAYRAQITALLARIVLPADAEEDGSSLPAANGGGDNQPRSPHPHYSLEELELMGIYP